MANPTLPKSVASEKTILSILAVSSGIENIVAVWPGVRLVFKSKGRLDCRISRKFTSECKDDQIAEIEEQNQNKSVEIFVISKNSREMSVNWL